MLPADQGLGTGDLAGRQIDLRLQRQAQLAARHGVGQRIFDFRADLMFLRQAVGEQVMLSAATRLGAVHGEVGGAHQRFHRLAMVRRNGDADRRANVDAVTLHLERFGDCKRDPSRQHLDLGDRFDVREEHGEFVTGEARQERSRRASLAEFGGDHDAAAGWRP